MTKKTPHLLFTRSLNQRQIAMMQEPCFSYESIAFNRIELIPHQTWITEASEQVDAWVFSSKYAVKSISKLLPKLNIPNSVYSVGENTSNELAELGISSIHPKTHTMKELASLISDKTRASITHFCGNLKVAELGDLLDEHANIQITSIQVYKNTLTPQKIDSSMFNGIVFMSPSAVRSYFNDNTVNTSHTLFCIGTTTAHELAKFTSIEPIIPPLFTFQKLSETIKETFC